MSKLTEPISLLSARMSMAIKLSDVRNAMLNQVERLKE
jgi:hypothetical protein